jgi:hypothetical protein
VSIFARDGDFVLFQGRCVKPHETRAVHVFIKEELVCVGHVLPVRVMLAILAQLMWEIAFFILGAKVQANASAVRKQSFIWEHHLPVLILGFFGGKKQVRPGKLLRDILRGKCTREAPPNSLR